MTMLMSVSKAKGKKIIILLLLSCCLAIYAGQVKITGQTSKYGAQSKKGITINAVVNGAKRKLCNKKRLKHGESCTLKCNAPDQVQYVTIATNSKDNGTGFWQVKYFIVELPNGEKWQFPEKDYKATTILSINGLTFYFTGEHAGELHNGKHGEKTKFWCKGKKL